MGREQSRPIFPQYHNTGNMTKDAVKRKDAQMQEQKCFKFCSGCEGCSNYTSNRVKCTNCAPEYRRCACSAGYRFFMTTDGWLAVTSLTDPTGRDKTIGTFVKIRQIVAPQLGTDKNLIGLDQVVRTQKAVVAPCG